MIRHLSYPVLILLFTFLPTILHCDGRPDATRIVIDYNGKKRSCLFEMPRIGGNTQGGGYPLLASLHGRNESARLHRYCVTTKDFYDVKGVAVVYPEGSGRIRHHWNDPEREASFVIALIDTLLRRYPLDSSRVYAAGFSQGGFLALRLACRYPQRIAAIALVESWIDSAFVADTCEATCAVPMIVLHSGTDHASPYDSFTYRGKWFNSVPAGVAAWARKMQCDPAPDSLIRHPGAEMSMWKNDNGERVVLWTTERGGHGWPGGRGIFFIPHFEPTHAINANELLWGFFKQYPGDQ